MCIIIGEIGSGKSSLLSAMLGQMLYVPSEELRGPLFDPDGHEQPQADEAAIESLLERLYKLEQPASAENHPVYIRGRTSFVEQQPWIQNMTLRENILFGKELDKRRYVETVAACQLESDLKLMPAGDRTEIGERGVTLSGG